jgi:hypothetical protein
MQRLGLGPDSNPRSLADVARQVQRLLEGRQQPPRLAGHRLVPVPVQLRDYFELASDTLLGLPDVALGLSKRVVGLGHPCAFSRLYDHRNTGMTGVFAGGHSPTQRHFIRRYGIKRAGSAPQVWR